ncbi:ABC transporter substrate-binding protein [Anaerosacchariphilus polymeriproducens]|uniref:Extracellular solute-binding protein n=1 Tax=Anaerosacchariphilus polymeriproducens TaxID=1812858 RepID=A0A371AVR5_9FIRM|nr:extracellular solute-binding protein [Anaerosacchariphilus polymeriproducens]RDU23570.1 extracellular solute-binding protein [Anaerosacchariphilus polymeriproducens]
MMARSIKKNLVFAEIIFIGMAAFIFCWKKTKQVKVITFGMFIDNSWDSSDNNSTKVIEHAIKKFEKEHPGVRVKYESGICKNDYSEWLTGCFLKGTEPDVFFISKDDFNALSSKGALLNIDKLINKDRKFKKNAYYNSLLESGQYKKKQYAIPYSCIPLLMCVNKTLLEREGVEIPDNDWTWGDFHQICRKVTKDKDRNGIVDQFGVYNYTWKDAAYSNGALLFNEEGTNNYVSARNVVNAVNFVYKINSLTDGYNVSEKDFEKGNVAFSPMFLSDYRTYKTYPGKVVKYTNFEWTCISMPAGPEGDNISEINTLLAGISARTQEKKLAWEFLKVLIYDKEIQTEVSVYSKGISAIKDIVESEKTYRLLERENQVHVKIQLLTDVMRKGVTIPKFENYDEVFVMMNEGVMAAMNSDKNINVSLITLQAYIKNYMKNGGYNSVNERKLIE